MPAPPHPSHPPHPPRRFTDPTIVIRRPRCGKDAGAHGRGGRAHERWTAACRCTRRHCGLAAEHTIAWPEAGWFRTSVAGQELWFANRDHIGYVRAYIAATVDRNVFTRGYREYAGLRRLPARIISAKNREKVLRALDRLAEA